MVKRSEVFISYSSKDGAFARRLHAAIESVGAKTFLAEISLSPGSKWSEEILEELRSSQFVFFVASKAACQSGAVQQELGASLVQRKHVIPILVDISASELPGFIGGYQAIDARTGEKQLQETIQAVGKKLRDDKFLAGLILGAIALAVLTSK